MTSIDFYFDFRSPYSYLAHSQLGTLDAELSYHPVDIVAAMKQGGNTPTTLTCPAKGKYAGADLQRWAKRYGVPLSRHKDIKSIDGRRPLRAAEDCGLAKEVVAAIFPAFWRHGLPLSTAGDLVRILEASGIRDPQVASSVDSSELDDRLTQRNEAAGARGIFGAPTFIVNDEMFFDNDRLEFIREELRAA
ncbi:MULTISPECIES: 2-hydroxychromene-2-carboxylate isomerase [unclassified Bradyrhizobium]|uniref:2-hydroxychromene-2-carboxylate isomerase n=1 Tax=unclassified Bradyrhizobium TaxID=2631580 RepID=UPI0028E8C7F5|nr:MULTISPECIES: 2-hydroxychromene-2-carboxylate isomerase [unclassified Bradyrhizobium]